MEMINNSRGLYQATPHLNNNNLIERSLMSTIIYHNHHIIPKYRCKEIGIYPDFPENIIRLTRLEHAEAHYHRWLKNGRSEDLGAAIILARGEIDELDTSGKNNSFYDKKHSPETRKKMSEALMGDKNPFYGKSHSPETRKKISESHMGKNHSPETRRKLSEVRMGENNSFYGKKHSPETRKKLSEAHMGKNHSPETRRKLSEALMGDNNPMYGKTHSPETRKKMSVAQRSKPHNRKNKQT